MRTSVENDLGDTKPPSEAKAGLRAALPFRRWLEARAPEIKPIAEPPPGLRILVVADHEVTRKAFSLSLSPICDIIYMADSGAEALRALETARFDLVFMDVHMPAMGGVEAVCALRDVEPAGVRTPVVAICSGLTDADREACLLAGMSGFASTPVESRSLFALVRSVLAETQQLAQAA